MKSQRMRTLGNAVETPAAHMVFMMKSAISLWLVCAVCAQLCLTLL